MSGKLLAQGLLNAKLGELQLAYALLETNLFDILGEQDKDVPNQLEKNLDNLIESVEKVQNEELRIKLFLHILKLLNIKVANFNSQKDIESLCNQIVEKVYHYQKSQDEKFAVFASRRKEVKAIQLVMYQMQNMFNALDKKINALSNEKFQELTKHIEQFIYALSEERKGNFQGKHKMHQLTANEISLLLKSKGINALLEVVEFSTLISFIIEHFESTFSFEKHFLITSVVSELINLNHFALSESAKYEMLLPIVVTQLILPIVIDGPKEFDTKSFVDYWCMLHKKYEESQSILTAAEEKYNSLNQQLKKICDEINHFEICLYIAEIDKVSTEQKVKKLLSNLKHSYNDLSTGIEVQDDKTSKDGAVKSFFHKMINHDSQQDNTNQNQDDEMEKEKIENLEKLNDKIEKLEEQILFYKKSIKENCKKRDSLRNLLSDIKDQIDEQKNDVKKEVMELTL